MREPLEKLLVGTRSILAAQHDRNLNLMIRRDRAQFARAGHRLPRAAR
jgi:hypothetical protein